PGVVSRHAQETGGIRDLGQGASDQRHLPRGEAEPLGSLEKSLAAGGKGLVDGGSRSCAAQLVDVLGESFDRDRLAALEKGSEGAAVGRRGEGAGAFDLQEGLGEVGRKIGRASCRERV